MGQAWSVAWQWKRCGKIIVVHEKKITQTYKWLEWNIEIILVQAPHLADAKVGPKELLYLLQAAQSWGNLGWNTPLPLPHHPGLFPCTPWPLPFWYPLDKSISTHEASPSPSSLYTKWTGKKEMLVKTNLYLVFSIYGTISVTRQSLCCKIAPPTHNPHFPMTPACQSLTKSKPNFMPSKDQVVNYFVCHTSTRITWQLQLSVLKWTGSCLYVLIEFLFGLVA